MIKYFCDGCGKELPEPYCIYTLSFILCDKCLPLFMAKYTKDGVTIIPPRNTILDLYG